MCALAFHSTIARALASRTGLQLHTVLRTTTTYGALRRRRRRRKRRRRKKG
jgi:hypothetical protein